MNEEERKSEADRKVRRLIRRMNEVERQEGRLKKFLAGLHYLKPSEARRRRSSFARWRARVRPRLPEVRTLDGSIWKAGRLLTPRRTPGA